MLFTVRSKIRLVGSQEQVYCLLREAGTREPVHIPYSRAVWTIPALREQISTDEFLRRGQDGVLQYALIQHEEKYVLTWYSNDDRILVRSQSATSLDDCRTFQKTLIDNTKSTDHVLVRARFRLRLSTHLRKLPPNRLNVAIKETPEKREALSNTIVTPLSITPSTPTDKVSVDNQLRTLKTVKTVNSSKQLKHWISAATVQIISKATETHLLRSLEYRKLQREATFSARVD